MILIVDMNWKRNSLAFNEFVSPIVSAVQPLEECEVKHFLDIEHPDLNRYSKVVLSGTALKDHTTLKQIDKFNWIKASDKPILGICAGMQTISLVFGEPLTTCLQIGITEITTLKENPLFQGDFKAYALHNYSVEPSQTFETLAESSKCIQAIKHKQKNIYGVLFHPEVRNQEILKRFIQINQ
ncbi:MAG: gamma-glutamyl-gamma-aminobutyrate hydrolase family protein [Chloroflexi bacterium]|nr:gamma-glutamyl-gamma-aminobutyrate hydrolase family protein [Chloroflexota bacterium]MCL5949596.1 gamma-glutamyl-gamma-aminobutyrate hydrolase family protein [Candidatus Bathyarchaeota archaeon]